MEQLQFHGLFPLLRPTSLNARRAGLRLTSLALVSRLTYDEKPRLSIDARLGREPREDRRVSFVIQGDIDFSLLLGGNGYRWINIAK